MSGTLFLTSTGLTSPAVRAAFALAAEQLANKKVALVTTASEDKERNQYAQLGKSQLNELGFAVDFVDLQTDPKFDFSSYDAIYVNGGNTFTLLKYANEAKFKESVLALLDRGGIYVGVSAGAIIACPDMTVAIDVEPDPNEVGLTDFTALHLVDFYLDVHYTSANEAALVAYEKKYDRQVERLTDEQALKVQDGNVQRIG